MANEEFKEVLYTIEIDWERHVVMLNNPVAKERIVVTEKDAKSITNAFTLLEARKKGLV